MEFLIIGDSISYGWGVDRSTESYAALLRKRLEEYHSQVLIRNEGIPGDTVLDGLAKKERALAGINPGYIIINFGSNDGLPSLFAGEVRVSLDLFRQKLTQLVAYFQESTQAQIFLLTTTIAEEQGIVDSFLLYNQVIKEVAKERGIQAIDIFTPLLEAGKENTILGDGLHPSAYGHRVIYNQIISLITC